MHHTFFKVALAISVISNEKTTKVKIFEEVFLNIIYYRQWSFIFYEDIEKKMP